MEGFELGISSIGSDRSANCATTSDQSRSLFSRWEDGQDSIPKVLAAPIEAYNFHVECQTLEELQNIQVTHPIILKTALGEISRLGHKCANPDVGSVRGALRIEIGINQG